MNPELIRYFGNGLNAWLLHHSTASARENFLWCTEQIDGTQCDLYRALAALDDTPAPPALIEQIYKTLPTWGRLLTATGQSLQQNLTEDGIITTVTAIKDLGITFPLRTRTIAHLGYAAVLIENGRYDDALQSISTAPSAIPITQLVKTNIYFKSQRWQDVIDQAEEIRAPLRYDTYERQTPPGDTDALIQAAAYLMSGAGYAHLGNFVAAKDCLKRADTHQYINIGAEACYYLGLISRAEGDEDAAKILFNSGLAYAKTEKLVSALADQTIRLRQTTAELIKQRTSYWDINTEPDLIEIQATERAENQSSLLAAAGEELAGQIGMTEVKEQVRRLKSDVAYAQEAARRGRETRAKSLHIAFTGPPGTGKTTIARVIARIFCGLGILKKDVIAEVRRDHLVGAHIGETELKTNAVIDSALDGVLFIDEAYSLVAPGSKNDFGKVALDTLLARMENERDRLVVIIAGYENEISEMLSTNEGLNSRFSRRIRFHSYTPDEIGEIAEVIATKGGAILPPDSRQLIATETRNLLMVSDQSGKKLLDIAGNGRFVRNVVEIAEEYRSARLDGANLQAMSDEEFFSLTPDDIAPALRTVIDPILGRRPPTEPAASPQNSHHAGEN